jgi:flagellar protein FliO/FliZ
MSSNLSPLFWFFVVLALIPLALWALKRSGLAAPTAHGRLRHVGVLPLSSSQKVVAIEVGSGDERRWLLLGVTPQNIQMLYTMLPDEEPLAPTPNPNAAFAQLLHRLRGESGNDRAR